MTDHTMKKNPISIPHTIWYTNNIHHREHKAADALGLTLYELMLHAGKAAFQVCHSAYPDTHHWLVLCSHGNNSSNGYVVAQLATAVSIEVTLLAQESDKPLPEEATLAHKAWLNTGGKIHASNIVWPKSVDLIVDALLSTSLQQAPHESISQLINHANSHPAPITAVDIPSSLLAETSATPGTVINTNHTITFIALKPGLLTGKAQDVTGQLHFDSLGLDSWLAGQETKIQQFSAEQLSHWLKPRRPTSHKGNHRQLVIISGNHSTAGAIHMTGEAALHAGAGLVQVLTHSENIAPLLTAQPELMVHELTMDSLAKSLEWANVVVIGPSLGQQEWGKKALQKVENFHKPMLWDANALNLLAINPNKHHNHVITPHPGKATQLLGCSITEIESDHLHCTKHLVQHYGSIAVLKGARTMVTTHPDTLGIIDVRNAGMASSSMGNVLSGIIGTLLGQKLSPYDAACAGCVAHSAAADILAARFGTHRMLATNLFSTLQHIVNPEVTDKNHDESSNPTP